MRLEWSAFALEDRGAIFDYIEAESPRAAIDVDEQIGNQLKLLIQHPKRGREGRVAGTREVVIAHTPYLAAYLISGETIRILRLLHHAQQWPDEMQSIGK